MSNSLLATRIRVQLNTLIFDKTLKRKDVANVSNNASGGKTSASSAAPSSAGGSGSGSGDDEGDDEDEKDTTFNTKTSLTNLFAIDAERCVDVNRRLTRSGLAG